MTPLHSPWRPIAGLFSILILAPPPVLPAGASSPDDAVVRSLTPRTNLPPERHHPARPGNSRLVEPSATIRRSYWPDDSGVAGATRIPYNAYRRSSFGTWSNFDEAK